jgi:hypothetical protein
MGEGWRRFFRFHLATLIVWALVAGVLIGTEFIPYEGPPFLPSEGEVYLYKGWPSEWYSQRIRPTVEAPHISLDSLAVSVFCDVLLAVPCAALFEWVYRKMHRHRPGDATVAAGPCRSGAR